MDESVRLNSARKPDDTFTNSKGESQQILLEVRHPEEQLIELEGRKLAISANLSTRRFCKGNWNISRAIVASEKVRAARLSFEHFKTPGMEGIYSAKAQSHTH